MIPFTSQVTAVPFAMQSEAANDCVCPSARLADGGESAVYGVQEIVTLALPDFDGSAALVAVTVAAGGDGAAAGAV